MIYFWILFKDKNHFHPQVMHSTKRCKPESGKACQWSSAVRSSSLFPWCIWAWGASSGGASLKRRRPFFPNLGLQFCHQLVKVLASANHFSSLVDGVDLMRIKRTVSIYLSGFESWQQLTMPPPKKRLDHILYYCRILSKHNLLIKQVGLINAATAIYYQSW